MTKFRRILNAFGGFLLIVVAILGALQGKYGYNFLAVVVAIWLLIRGIQNLVYYFTMARYMVGGKDILCIGVILVDLGLFTLTLTAIPKSYIMIYMMLILLFSGVVDILGAREAKKLEAPSWRSKLVFGIIEALAGVACIVCIRYAEACEYIFCSGIFYSGVMRIISSFRKNAIVYTQ